MITLLTSGHSPAIATHDSATDFGAARRRVHETHVARDAFEFQMLSRHPGATWGPCSSTRATACACSCRSDGEWFPYFMRRLGEQPGQRQFCDSRHSWRTKVARSPTDCRRLVYLPIRLVGFVLVTSRPISTYQRGTPSACLLNHLNRHRTPVASLQEDAQRREEQERAHGHELPDQLT